MKGREENQTQRGRRRSKKEGTLRSSKRNFLPCLPSLSRETLVEVKFLSRSFCHQASSRNQEGLHTGDHAAESGKKEKELPPDMRVIRHEKENISRHISIS